MNVCRRPRAFTRRKGVQAKNLYQREAAESNSESPAIRLTGVSKHYRRGSGKEFIALNPTDLEIAGGEFISIVGPSGCGKTTLDLLIAGLIKPTTGHIQIGENRISAPYPRLGVVFQRDSLLEWRTVIKNLYIVPEMLGHPRRMYRQRAWDLLDMAGLREFVHYYPSQLSGGMRQRVAICRALLNNPKVLVMDEPFGALDALTREQLQVDLSSILREHPATTVFVTHSIEEAVFLSDRVVIMSSSPGSVEDIVDIDLPRPRTISVRTNVTFEHCTQRIRAHFVSDGVLEERR